MQLVFYAKFLENPWNINNPVFLSECKRKVRKVRDNQAVTQKELKRKGCLPINEDPAHIEVWRWEHHDMRLLACKQYRGIILHARLEILPQIYSQKEPKIVFFNVKACMV